MQLTEGLTVSCTHKTMWKGTTALCCNVNFDILNYLIFASKEKTTERLSSGEERRWGDAVVSSASWYDSCTVRPHWCHKLPNSLISRKTTGFGENHLNIRQSWSKEVVRCRRDLGILV